MVVSDSSGKDIMMGDLNARHQLWDSITNAKGRALVRWTSANGYSGNAPVMPTYRPRGRRGASTPDLVVTKIRMSKTKTAGEVIWTGAHPRSSGVFLWGGGCEG